MQYTPVSNIVKYTSRFIVSSLDHRFFYLIIYTMSIIQRTTYYLLYIMDILMVDRQSFYTMNRSEYFRIRVYLLCNVYRYQAKFHVAPLPSDHRCRLTTDNRRRSPSPTAQHDV